MAERFRERPAAGTRVYLEGYPGWWHERAADQNGTVIGHRSDSDVYVRFDNGFKDWGEWRYLRPEAPAPVETPAPAPEVTLNGHRYVLAETPTPEAEEQREPKQAEIWRTRLGNLVIVTDETDDDSDPYCVRLKGVAAGQKIACYTRRLTFAYPSLAAAIKAGETFE